MAQCPPALRQHVPHVCTTGLIAVQHQALTRTCFGPAIALGVCTGECAMKSKVMFLLVLSASLVWGNDRKLSPELKGRHSNNVVDVIVQFKATPTMQHEARVSRHGALVKQHLGPVKGFLLSVCPRPA